MKNENIDFLIQDPQSSVAATTTIEKDDRTAIICHPFKIDEK